MKLNYRQEGEACKYMIIYVDYDPETDVIDNVEVYAVDYKTPSWVDITKSLEAMPGHPLDEILDAIDWRKIYKDEVYYAQFEHEPAYEY